MFRIFVIVVLASAAWCDDKIINGETVSSITEVPFQVSLQKNGNHFCGGSIIGTRFIMSAAHCLVYRSGVYAVMGVTNLNDHSNLLAELIQYWYQHPYWNENTFDYDFSLAILSRDLPLSNRIYPVTLAYGEAFGTAVTTGWGMTHGSISSSASDTLQRINVPLITQAQCMSYFGNQITPAMQCAGGQGTSACKGDSGGPLVIYTSSGVYLVGNTSWGSYPCETSKPSMWSKNIYAIDWLQYMGVPLYDWN